MFGSAQTHFEHTSNFGRYLGENMPEKPDVKASMPPTQPSPGGQPSFVPQADTAQEEWGWAVSQQQPRDHVPPDQVLQHVSQDFMALLKAYRPSGGLLRSQEAAARCKPREGTDGPTLALWIERREVISFKWLSRTWLPLFQFNRSDMTRQSGLEAVMAELVVTHDDWEIANWFCRPNSWLKNSTPADKLATDAPEVLAAARAARYGDTGLASL